MTPEELEAKAREAYKSARFASMGIELGVSVLLGLLGGWWLDIELDCRPWFLLLGIVLGFAAGIRSIVRTLRIFSAEADEDNQVENDDR
ncbi:MAG: AtpZ/AtpI family protein [Myxococcota bacterium]|nr:AtpZ/AtpI family protein [Myxococcota bacterium]